MIFTDQMDRQKSLIDTVFMSYSYPVASNEFAALCQSQIKLLTDGLGAVSSAIYLTIDVPENQESNLLLFVVNPSSGNKFPSQIKGFELLEIIEKISSQNESFSNYYLPGIDQEESNFSVQINQNDLLNKQIVLPLIHDDVAMGLLLVGRDDRPWAHHELDQIKLVSSTLAIACFFEKQSQWYQSQLRLQQGIHYWNQEQIGNLLHQLKNPLTALSTFSKLLLKRILPEDRNRKVVTNILRESDHLASLIEQFSQEIEVDQSLEEVSIELATTSKLIAGEVSTNAATSGNFLLPANQDSLESLDLAVVLEPLLLTSSTIAQSKGLKFSSNIDCESTLIMGNANALGEVLSNILDNAIKYTPNPGQIKVSTQSKTDVGNGKFLGVVIADTGYGISEENQQHLFTRYYRGSQAQSDIPGTGLGLAIAKQLINNMGGEIEVISPNHNSSDSRFPGTTMIVWLKTVSS